MRPLPEGWGITLATDTRVLAGGRVLLGGRPTRLLRLTTRGAATVAKLCDGAALDPAARALGGRLVDAELAHPIPRPPSAPPPGVVVAVPVYDRPVELARCLASLGNDVPIVVLDDGSTAAADVAAVCSEHGARLVRLDHNAGPSAARNAALDATTEPFVAFLDSDCVAPAGWIAALAAHLEDDRVAAVAPRVRPAAGGRSLLARYVSVRFPLDMGPADGRVSRGRRVPYVPTAAVVVRRSALTAVRFDESLRVGEDVDLVWRLDAAGWHVRYVADVVVVHARPRSWRALLGRQRVYGTSAASLHQRHPGAVAPADVTGWPGLAGLLLLAGTPAGALAAALAPAIGAAVRRNPPAAVPPSLVARAGIRATVAGTAALSRAAIGLAWPALALSVLLGRRRVRWCGAVLTLAMPTIEWCERRPSIDPLRWTAARLVDEAAYGFGVLSGAVRRRCLGPLVPAVRRRAGDRRAT
jgi:mycofactocin system glycosyltransferase